MSLGDDCTSLFLPSYGYPWTIPSEIEPDMFCDDAVHSFTLRALSLHLRTMEKASVSVLTDMHVLMSRRREDGFLELVTNSEDILKGMRDIINSRPYVSNGLAVMHVHVTISGEGHSNSAVFLVMEGRERVCGYDWTGGSLCDPLAKHVLHGLFRTVDVDKSLPIPACMWGDAWQKRMEERLKVKILQPSVPCSVHSLLSLPVLVSHVCNPSLEASKRVRTFLTKEMVSTQERHKHCLIAYLLACVTRILRSSTQFFPTEESRSAQGWPVKKVFPTKFVSVVCNH